MELRDKNKEIYDRYIRLDNIDSLAAPNLVSSKKFLNSVKENPIFYIGQETNGWVNFSNDNICFDDIEDSYDDFLINIHTTKTKFWQFLKKCTELNYDEYYKNVVWTNTILIGKRYSKGAPIDSKINDLSLEYLLFLYEYFKPEVIITVAGNTNPYYDITNKFLEKINSSLKSTWPTKDIPLLYDENKNIFWTYHPQRLCYDGNFNTISNKILKLK